MAHIGQGDTPFEDLRWSLAERFGWTLEYIDALNMEDLHEYLQVADGREKGSASFFNKGRQ